MKTDTPIAVASRSFSKHPVLRAEMEALYPNVRFNDTGASLAGDELKSFLSGCTMAVTALERVDDGLLSGLPELKVISKYGVGLDMIDPDALERQGVRLGWTGGVNRRSVAELALAAMILLMHRVPEAWRQVIGGGWTQVKGRELSRRTVGIVGCGFVGKELAVMLKALGCRVLAHDKLDFPEFYEKTGVEPVDLDTLLVESEAVTLHLPLDGSTRNLLSADKLERMRPGAIFVNMARGGLVDEDRLKGMLMDGRLAGAALDVLDREPPEDLELLRLPTVMATPHIGGSTEEAVLAMGRAAIAGLKTARSPKDVFVEAGYGQMETAR